MLDVNTACDCDETYSFSEDVAGRTWARCRTCGHQWVNVDAVAAVRPHGYTRPNTGNHPDHPPVPGGYRGGEGSELSRAQVINPGLATEAVIDVTSEPAEPSE